MGMLSVWYGHLLPLLQKTEHLVNKAHLVASADDTAGPDEDKKTAWSLFVSGQPMQPTSNVLASYIYYFFVWIIVNSKQPCDLRAKVVDSVVLGYINTWGDGRKKFKGSLVWRNSGSVVCPLTSLET